MINLMISKIRHLQFVIGLSDKVIINDMTTYFSCSEQINPLIKSSVSKGYT